jgi:hypothetical protein
MKEHVLLQYIKCGDVGTPESKGLLENLGADERIILKYTLKKLDMNWIVLAQDTDKWWALVNAVMNLRIPQNENFLSS